MQILLLRHGIAAVRAPSGRDADRELTSEGAEKLRQVLAVAKAAGVEPSLILSSPYRRARETADIAHSVLGCKQQIVESATLTPGGTPEAVWEELRAYKDEREVLLAGHEPLFSALAAHLLNAPSLLVDFKKGALLRVDTHSFGASPQCELRWMLTPRLCLAGPK